MIVFFDENMGNKIPEVLGIYGIFDQIHYLRREFSEAAASGPVQDVDWIPIVAERGWLIITKDRKMVNIREEREALVANRAAVVVIEPADLTLDEMFNLLVRQAHRLTEIASSTARPFVVQLGPDGMIRQIRIS